MLIPSTILSTYLHMNIKYTGICVFKFVFKMIK